MNKISSEAFLLSRRRQILVVVSIMSLILSVLSLLFTLLNFAGITRSSQSIPERLGYLAVSVIILVVSLLAWWLARRNQVKTIRLGAYLVTGMWAALVTAIACFNPVSISSLLVPLICAGLLFSSKEIAAWTFGLVGLLILSFSVASSGLLPSASGQSSGIGLFSAVSYVILLLLIGGGLWYLQINTGLVLTEINRQLTEMAHLSNDREEKRQLGLKVGQNVQQQAVALTGVSRQQESGATEQVTAISEVAAAMERLSDSARYMSDNSEKAVEVARRTQGSAESVRAAANEASRTTQEGLAVSQGTITAITQVQQQIQALEKQLNDLVGRSTQISGVVDLVRALADQTHLLALNAAIESAGAGEYGARFAVVADEVKQLADRSLKATREVQIIVSELQAAVSHSSEVAVTARLESESAAQKARRSGLVINELGQVIEVNSARANEILNEAQQVSEFITKIATISRSQQQATLQVTQTLHSIDENVRENAGTTRQLNQAINRLEVLSSELTQALADARQEQTTVERELVMA